MQDIGPIGGDRNWKGIAISLLVILVVLSLIGMSIVLLSKGDVQQHPHLLLCGQLSLRQPLLTFSHSLDLCSCICAVCPMRVNHGCSHSDVCRAVTVCSDVVTLPHRRQ